MFIEDNLYSKIIKSVPIICVDIIISFDISIPTRIVKNFPKQLWCYYISEPPLSDWKESFSQPLYGYDIFFTLYGSSHGYANVSVSHDEINYELLGELNTMNTYFDLETINYQNPVNFVKLDFSFDLYSFD